MKSKDRQKSAMSQKKRQTNTSKLLKLTCLFLFGLSITVVSISNAFHNNAVPPLPQSQTSSDAGLFGIFDEEAPSEINLDAFEILDGNWAEWSEGVANLVADLYEDDSLGISGQREKIAHLKIKLGTMEKAINDPVYFQIHDQLIMLHGRLSRRIDLADAILDTLEINPQGIRERQLQQTTNNLIHAARSTENDLNTYINGSAWSPYFELDTLKNVTGSSPDSMQVASKVKVKLEGRSKLQDAGMKKFLSRPVFDQLQTAVTLYLDASANLNKPYTAELLRKQLKQFVSAAEFCSERGLSSDALDLEKAIKSISTTAPDGGARMSVVVNQYYKNSNFHLAVGEGLLNQLMGDSKNDRSNINDCFMGSRSIGMADTSAFVSVDIIPNDSAAMFQLTLSGQSNTSTTSYASKARARIGAVGHHSFNAVRQLTFNGESLTPLGNSASMNVNPNIQITGAGTKYDGIWILGKYARKKAYRAALARRRQSEQHAADKLRERVLPEFNSEVQNKVSKMNSDLATGMNQRLRNLNLYPQQRNYRSTDNQILSTSLIAGLNELGGAKPNFGGIPISGASFSLHQSLINNTLSRMNLAGRTLTDEEFREEVESFISQLTGSPRTFSVPAPDSNPKDDKGPNQFVFAKKDPLRIQIIGGEVVLTMRTGFKQEGKPDIQQHIIKIPLSLHLVGDTIEIRRGIVGVSPEKGSASSLPVRGVIKKKIASSLPTRTRDRNIALKREGRSDVIIRVQKLKAQNGWLAIEAS